MDITRQMLSASRGEPEYLNKLGILATRYSSSRKNRIDILPRSPGHHCSRHQFPDKVRILCSYVSVRNIRVAPLLVFNMYKVILLS